MFAGGDGSLESTEQAWCVNTCMRCEATDRGLQREVMGPGSCGLRTLTGLTMKCETSSTHNVTLECKCFPATADSSLPVLDPVSGV